MNKNVNHGEFGLGKTMNTTRERVEAAFVPLRIANRSFKLATKFESNTSGCIIKNITTTKRSVLNEK